MPKRTVLIPLDRSDYSLKIVSQVEKFIPATGTKLVLFHVAAPATGIGVSASIFESDYMMPEPLPIRASERMPHPVYATQVEEALETDIKAELKPVVRQLEAKGYQVAVTVRVGDPADGILKTLREEKIDLVAMSTHAREGLKRLFFGSVAEKVRHHVNTPILLMHPSSQIEAP